jgi:hypothetical protein
MLSLFILKCTINQQLCSAINLLLLVAKLCVVPLRRARQWWVLCWVCPRHGCCRRAPRRCCCWLRTRRGTRRCFPGSLLRWRTPLCCRGRCCCSRSRRRARSQRRPPPPFLLPAGMPSRSSAAIWLVPEQNNYYIFISLLFLTVLNQLWRSVSVLTIPRLYSFVNFLVY